MAELRYFSFSRANSDSHCERSRYLSSEWGGTGLSPVKEGWDLTYGNLIHKYLNRLAKEGCIEYVEARLECFDAAIEAGMAVFLARDWSALAEGHLRGFVKAVWPRWMAEYEVVESEKLRSWTTLAQPAAVGFSPLDPSHPAMEYRFRYIQDLLLRNKFNGEIVYVDYKTSSSDDSKWIASWAKHPQLHSSSYAMLQQGVKVDQIIIQGIYKSWRDKKTGAPTSPFCRGWVNRQFSMSPEYSYVYQRSKGWEQFSTAEEFDDLSEWVANMPAELLSKQFPCTSPIMPRLDIGEEWFKQQLIREASVAEAVCKLQVAETEDEVQHVMRTYFKQDYTKCAPAFGFGCPFVNYCWIPSVSRAPLESGEFVRREQKFEDGQNDT